MTEPTFRKDTRAPSHLPPPGACDAQVHVFGPAAQYPLRRGASYKVPEDATIEAAEQLHRTLGFSRGVIVHATSYGTDTRILYDALRGRPNYRGITIVDDTVSDGELLKLHEAGVRGARFNFWKALNIAPSPESFRRNIERIQKLGWFAKIHVHGEELLDLGELIEPLTIRVVIDHMAHIEFKDGIAHPVCKRMVELLKRPNWWVMISNADRHSAHDAIWPDAVPVAQKLIETAPDQIVWGTDWPHVWYEKPKMPNDAELLELFYRYAPSAAMQKRILVDNAARLFDFPNP